MHVQFDTNEISKRDALCLMALLENIAGVDVPLNLGKEAVREHEATEKPKRGRPRKEQAAEVPVVDPTAAGTAEASEAGSQTESSGVEAAPAASSSSHPISMDDLRDSVNDHVSRNGMPSAQLVFKEFGCQRANEIMALEPAQQHAFLAKMKK